MAWLYFAAVQVVTLLFTVLGWFLLIPFCLMQDWQLSPWPSLEDGRFIDEWRWEPLNWIYGQPIDGVSGKEALIWNSTGQRVPYMPKAWAPWRAFCWNARNSAGQLKYVFAWNDGPFVQGTWLFGRTYKLGWQKEAGGKVPVLSL